MKKRLLIFALLLSACQPEIQLGSAFSPDDWLAVGKISYQYENCQQECKTETLQGNLHWKHLKNHDILTIHDPFGNEHLKLEYRDNLVKVTEKQTVKTYTVQELEQQLHLPLPIQNLSKWLLDKNQEKSFENASWHLNFSQWRDYYFRSIVLKKQKNILKIIINQLGK